MSYLGRFRASYVSKWIHNSLGTMYAERRDGVEVYCWLAKHYSSKQKGTIIENYNDLNRQINVSVMTLLSSNDLVVVNRLIVVNRLNIVLHPISSFMIVEKDDDRWCVYILTLRPPSLACMLYFNIVALTNVRYLEIIDITMLSISIFKRMRKRYNLHLTFTRKKKSI